MTNNACKLCKFLEMQLNVFILNYRFTYTFWKKSRKREWGGIRKKHIKSTKRIVYFTQILRARNHYKKNVTGKIRWILCNKQTTSFLCYLSSKKLSDMFFNILIMDTRTVSCKPGKINKSLKCYMSDDDSRWRNNFTFYFMKGIFNFKCKKALQKHEKKMFIISSYLHVSLSFAIFLCV